MPGYVFIQNVRKISSVRTRSAATQGTIHSTIGRWRQQQGWGLWQSMFMISISPTPAETRLRRSSSTWLPAVRPGLHLRPSHTSQARNQPTRPPWAVYIKLPQRPRSPRNASEARTLGFQPSHKADASLISVGQGFAAAFFVKMNRLPRSPWRASPYSVEGGPPRRSAYDPGRDHLNARKITASASPVPFFPTI